MAERTVCNCCEVRGAYREFYGEPLCTPCTITRLTEQVEVLMSAYVTVTAEVRYENG